MRWEPIKRVDIDVKEGDELPIRMKLMWSNGNVIVAAGLNVPSTTVTLFSTAGLGRYPPGTLVDILRKKFHDRMGEAWLVRLINELS
jgi:hypothetical protein